MDTLHFVKKGKLMNSLEKLYMFSETIRKDQISEESTSGSNKMYDVVIQHEDNRRQLRLSACFLIHSLPHSHPISLQVNIILLLTCKYDMVAYENTAMRAERAMYEFSYFVN